jgi:hypothetical protein
MVSGWRQPSGRYGQSRLCAGIADHPDLRLPSRSPRARKPRIAGEPLPIEAPPTYTRGATACTFCGCSSPTGEARHAVRPHGYSAARVCALGSGDMPRAHL